MRMSIIIIILIIICVIGFLSIRKQQKEFKNVDIFNEIENPKEVCKLVNKYEFGSGSPRILLITGSHGNEIGGSVAYMNIISDLNNGTLRLKKGSLVIIPTANLCGLLMYDRYNQYMDPDKRDINRNYPKENGEITDTPINREIIEEVSKADFICDSHGAVGYYLLNNTISQPFYSMGSTITCGKTDKSKEITEKCLMEVNKLIPKDVYNYKRFVTFPDEVLKGSLRNYANNMDKHYILTELSEQNEIEPINVREKQQRVIVLTVLREYGMIN